MSVKPKPIRNSRVVGRQFWNVPNEGPVIPRLREGRETTEAIGFVHRFDAEPQHEGDE